jgi:hypothetical protein
MSKPLLFIVLYLQACLAYCQVSDQKVKHMLNQGVLPTEIPYPDEASALTQKLENSSFYQEEINGWSQKQNNAKTTGNVQHITFTKTLSVPTAWKDKKIFLLIHPLMADIMVTLNGQPLNCCRDITLSSLPLSPFIKPEGNNVLEISIISSKPVNEINDMLKRVALFATPKVHISYLANEYYFYTNNRINFYPFQNLWHYYHNFGDSTWYTHQQNTQVKIYDEERIIFTSAPYTNSKSSNKTSEGMIGVGKDQPGLKRWTAETPSMHLMSIQNLTPTGEVREAFAERVGFRDSALKDKHLFVSRVAPQLKAVALNIPRLSNYSRERLAEIAVSLKRHHVNTIVVSGFLENKLIYEVCDQYGLYVIHKINVQDYVDETEDPKKIADKLMRRVMSNLYLLKNRPSLIAWYIDQEDNWKPIVQPVADALNLIELARPVIYNDQVVENLPSMKDIPTLNIPLEEAQLRMLEKKYQWIDFTMSSYKDKTLTITNTYDFMKLDSIRLHWEVLDKNQVVTSGNIFPVCIMPHKAHPFALPFDLPSYKDKPGITFRFTLFLHNQTAWLDKGAVLASENFRFNMANNNYFLEKKTIEK